MYTITLLRMMRNILTRYLSLSFAYRENRHVYKKKNTQKQKSMKVNICPIEIKEIGLGYPLHFYYPLSISFSL